MTSLEKGTRNGKAAARTGARRKKRSNKHIAIIRLSGGAGVKAAAVIKATMK